MHRLALAAHARVEVDLLVAGGDVGGHHGFGLGQGILGRQVPPRVGAEVVAAEDHPFTAREPDPVGNAVDLVTEGGRGQARVTTLVVDLVASRLDQDRCPLGGRLAQGRLDHRRVRGAHRGDAGRTRDRRRRHGR